MVAEIIPLKPREGFDIEPGKQHTFSAREIDSNKKIVIRREGHSHDLEIFRFGSGWVAKSGERVQKLEENKPTLLRVSLNVDVTAGPRGVAIHSLEPNLSLNCSIETMEGGDFGEVVKNLASKFWDKVRALMPDVFGQRQEA